MDQRGVLLIKWGKRGRLDVEAEGRHEEVQKG